MLMHENHIWYNNDNSPLETVHLKQIMHFPVIFKILWIVG